MLIIREKLVLDMGSNKIEAFVAGNNFRNRKGYSSEMIARRGYQKRYYQTINEFDASKKSSRLVFL